MMGPGSLTSVVFSCQQAVNDTGIDHDDFVVFIVPESHGESPGRKRILAYFEGHRTLLFVSI